MKKVLIIDDNEGMVNAITLLLHVSGYSSESISEGGDELEEKVLKSCPDLILLDVLLSGEDGRDIARTLKRTESTRHIPIIMVSALPSVRDSAIEAGADNFVAKPFNIQELLQLLEQYSVQKDIVVQGNLD